MHHPLNLCSSISVPLLIASLHIQCHLNLHLTKFQQFLRPSYNASSFVNTFNHLREELSSYSEFLKQFPNGYMTYPLTVGSRKSWFLPGQEATTVSKSTGSRHRLHKFNSRVLHFLALAHHLRKLLINVSKLQFSHRYNDDVKRYPMYRQGLHVLIL